MTFVPRQPTVSLLLYALRALMMNTSGLSKLASFSAPLTAVTTLRASLFRAAWLRAAVRGSVVYVLAWGLTTLVVRYASVDAPLVAWWWGAPGLAVVVAAAAWWAARRTPSPDAVAALLDRRRGLGGLAMSSDAPGFAPWSGHVAGAQPRQCAGAVGRPG